ncbi:hypothetical protein ABPG72_008820 [Tetrahymena utriculariae]
MTSAFVLDRSLLDAIEDYSFIELFWQLNCFKRHETVAWEDKLNITSIKSVIKILLVIIALGNKYTLQWYIWFTPSAKPLVFIYICGETKCNSLEPNSSFPQQITQIHKGIIFSLQGRFYGKRQPFRQGKYSYSIENLKYLYAQQALNDIAQFIQYVKDNKIKGVTSQMPWIYFGGSYPGALSAY